MTGANVIGRVRNLINDTVSPYRWEDTVLLDWINDGVRDVRRLRPDAKFDSNANVVAYSSASATGDTLILDNEWKTALVEYVCFKCFDQDGADEADLKRMYQHKKQYAEVVLT